MKKKILIVSGPSGAGKFSTLKVLEDVGFYAADNLPPEIFPSFLTWVKKNRKQPVAVVMDARNPEFLLNFDHYKKGARRLGIEITLLFIEAQDAIILRRFSETRRRHPLSPFGNVQEGIEKERKLLQGLKKNATQVIDTSYLTVHELREVITKGQFAQSLKKKTTALAVNVVSFGYRYGLPLDADLVIDVRFLPNPFFEPSLTKLSGRHPSVKNFLHKTKEARLFFPLFRRLLKTLLTSYQKEGKTYLTVAFGCTGGRHRSVTVAEETVRDLKKWGFTSIIRHRDVNK